MQSCRNIKLHIFLIFLQKPIDKYIYMYYNINVNKKYINERLNGDGYEINQSAELYNRKGTQRN